MKKREKAIITGLYLSKFDKKALDVLGFIGFTEAFNTIGYAIGVKPASIKNYRDEFDPYFPNRRKGWHKRQFREYCKQIYTEYADLDFINFTDFIKSLVFENYDIEKIIPQSDRVYKSESVAKRLITGKAAEEYFIKNYESVSNFKDYNLKDTRNLACGFDFKLFNTNSHFYCVEVKGLNSNSGSITLTEKEFIMADKLENDYCLFIVLNFVEKPHHRFEFNPLNSGLTFKKIKRQITQISYGTIV